VELKPRCHVFRWMGNKERPLGRLSLLYGGFSEISIAAGDPLGDALLWTLFKWMGVSQQGSGHRHDSHIVHTACLIVLASLYDWVSNWLISRTPSIADSVFHFRFRIKVLSFLHGSARSSPRPKAAVRRRQVKNQIVISSTVTATSRSARFIAAFLVARSPSLAPAPLGPIPNVERPAARCSLRMRPEHLTAPCLAAASVVAA